MIPVRHLSLFITENCNLRCPYCFAAGGEGTRIDPQLARQGVDFFLEHAGEEQQLHLSLWGGEPFLNFPLIRELIPYARQKARGRQLSVSIPTNVTLLNEEIIKFAKQQRISLSLSLDGLPASQNRRPTISGQGSFALVLQGLAALKQYGGKVLPPVRKTVTPANVAEMVADTGFFLKQGFRQLALSPVLEEHWTPEALEQFEHGQLQLAEIWLRYLEAGDPFFVVAWNDLWMLTLLHRHTSGLPAGVGFFCGAGSSMLAVDMHGDIFPCHRFVFYDRSARTQQLGNLAEGLREEARLRYCEFPAGNNSEPGGGWSAGLCNRLCPATNYRISGDIYRAGELTRSFLGITRRVLAQIDRLAGNSVAYKAFLDNLIKGVYKSGSASRFTRLFWQGVGRKEQAGLGDRAAEILDNLRRRKKNGA